MRGVLFYSLSSFCQRSSKSRSQIMYLKYEILYLYVHISSLQVYRLTLRFTSLCISLLYREEDRWSFVDITVHIFVVFGSMFIIPPTNSSAIVIISVVLYYLLLSCCHVLLRRLLLQDNSQKVGAHPCELGMRRTIGACEQKRQRLRTCSLRFRKASP